MFKFKILPNNNENKPYYLISIKFSLLDEEIETTTIKISEEKFNKYNEDVNNLLIYLYTCHYSSANTKGNLNNYDHVQGRCYYDKYTEDLSECTCGYSRQVEQEEIASDGNDGINREHPRCKILYKHPIISNFHSCDNCHYRFVSIKIEYFDKNYSKHDVDIEFSNESINKIVDGIIKSHTIKYGWLPGRFNSKDPQIFKDVHKIITNNEGKLADLNFDEQKKIIMNLYENRN